jgi:hypothetical protein
VDYYFIGRVDLDAVGGLALNLDMFFALLSCTANRICSSLTCVAERRLKRRCRLELCS